MCKFVASDEAKGFEIQNVLLHGLKADLEDRRGRKIFVDLTGEELPSTSSDSAPAASEPVISSVSHDRQTPDANSSSTSHPSASPEVNPASEEVEAMELALPSSPMPPSPVTTNIPIPGVSTPRSIGNSSSGSLGREPSVKRIKLDNQSSVPEQPAAPSQSATNPASSTPWKSAADGRWLSDEGNGLLVGADEGRQHPSGDHWMTDVEEKIWRSSGFLCIQNEESRILLEGTQGEAVAGQIFFQTDQFTGLAAPKISYSPKAKSPSKARSDELPKPKITDEQWPGFIAVTRKECAGIFNQKAVTVIPPKEAELIRRHKADPIVSSRHVYGFKSGDGAGSAPIEKSSMVRSGSP